MPGCDICLLSILQHIAYGQLSRLPKLTDGGEKHPSTAAWSPAHATYTLMPCQRPSGALRYRRPSYRTSASAFKARFGISRLLQRATSSTTLQPSGVTRMGTTREPQVLLPKKAKGILHLSFLFFKPHLEVDVLLGDEELFSVTLFIPLGITHLASSPRTVRPAVSVVSCLETQRLSH